MPARDEAVRAAVVVPADLDRPVRYPSQAVVRQYRLVICVPVAQGCRTVLAVIRERRPVLRIPASHELRKRLQVPLCRIVPHLARVQVAAALCFPDPARTVRQVVLTLFYAVQVPVGQAGCLPLRVVLILIPRRALAVPFHPLYPIEAIIGVVNRLPVPVGHPADGARVYSAVRIGACAQCLAADLRLGLPP